LPFPGGPNNRIPRTGARKPVNIYRKKNIFNFHRLFQFTSGRRTGRITASSSARLAPS